LFENKNTIIKHDSQTITMMLHLMVLLLVYKEEFTEAVGKYREAVSLASPIYPYG
jgi:hypothetical protein